MTSTFVTLAAFAIFCYASTSAAAEVGAETRAKIEKLPGFDDCLKSSNVNKEDIFTFPVKETKELGCFNKCLMEKQDLLNADGSVKSDKLEEKFNAVSFSEKLPKDYLPKLITCVKDVKLVECEDYFKIEECMINLLKSN